MKTSRQRLALIGLLLFHGGASAENLVQNPQFNDGLAGWFAFGDIYVNGFASLNEQHGSDTAPSVRISAGSNIYAARSWAYARQCINMGNGIYGPWSFGGRARVTSNPGSSGTPPTFRIRLIFSSVVCGASGGVTLASPDAVAGEVEVAGVPGPFTQYSYPILADPQPNGELSYSVVIEATVEASGSGGSSISAVVDNVYFRSVNVIFANGFD